MSSWARLLADVREDLQDTGTTPRWTDQALYLYLKDAIRDYGKHFPLRFDRVVLVFDTDHYTLPADFKRALLVESPLDRALEQKTALPGQQRNPPSASPYYYWLAGGLYLDKPTTADVLLTYEAWHPLPASEQDGDFAITVPEEDEELLRLYITAKAQTIMRGRTARLDRFRPGQGRGDNPMIYEVEDLFLDYRRALAAKKGVENIFLHRKNR